MVEGFDRRGLTFEVGKGVLVKPLSPGSCAHPRLTSGSRDSGASRARSGRPHPRSRVAPTENVLEYYFQGWKMVLPEGVEFVILGWRDKALHCQMLVWGNRKILEALSGLG